MKSIFALPALVAVLVLHVITANPTFAAEEQPPIVFEYVTIRWAGRDNTHIIRPGGKVEFIGHEFRKVARPDRTDERAFYMNIAMNGLTKDGWEFAGMTHDEIVMKRTLAK